MKKIFGILITAIVAFSMTTATAGAGEIDVLLDKLVEKGILTPLEAQNIQEETKAQVSDELAKQKSYAVPDWVQKMKFKGDLRIRYQFQDKKGSQTRNRGRVRYRLGVETKVADQVTVAAGLASGSDDPRSTNQTFQNTFDTPDIRLDYAYAEWEANDWLTVVTGKHKRKSYLWLPTDLLWDGDINPEGGAIHITGPETANTQTWLNGGIWVLDESSGDTSDPYLAFVQPGASWKDGDFDAKVAFTYYSPQNITASALDNSAGTNTVDSAGNLVYNYSAYSPAAEFGIKKPFGLPFDRVAVFGEYVHNPAPEDENNGWAVGMKFGDKKVSKPGTWQGKYIYANLEKDAWLDTFPDSDRYDGETNVKSHEFIVQYALKKNVIFGIDYYYSDVINGIKAQQNVLQADVNFKF